MRKIRIGSRDSRLAAAQAKIICDLLQQNHPEVQLELVTMKTTGDRMLDMGLETIGEKGLFIKELDMALLEERIDIAVHSLKDIPLDIPEDFRILAYGKREDARDVLVYHPDLTVFPEYPMVGSGSKRRMLQMQALYPKSQFLEIRGNIQTRLRRLIDEKMDATILAAAGLKRLRLQGLPVRFFSIEEMIPAAGQGILAVQGRRDMDMTLFKEIDDGAARTCALAERAFVKELGGGCMSATTAHAVVNGKCVFLYGLYYREKDGRWFKDWITGRTAEADELGKRLACRMREKGRLLN